MAHKTYIYDAKSADTVVLFIHGFLGSTEHFERFIALLPEHISVYNILLDGHGGSVRDFANASMAKWKCRIEDVIAHLNQKYNKIYIVAHSMGTFFAIDAAIKYPNTVKTVFLLQMPLKIGVKPSAVLNTLKSFFNVFGDDKIGRAYKNSHSIKLNFRIWEYIGWIPRYLELFKESKEKRSAIVNVQIPCLIFQSAKDELVSMKSVNYIPQKRNMKINILKKSAHFIYDSDEWIYLEEMFLKMIDGSATE